MEIIETKISEVFIIEPKKFKDDRGWFMESFNDTKFPLDTIFVQDNHSFSKGNVIRGLHFQKKPGGQAKLVRCTSGAICDVAVDIRKGSPTFLQHVMVELSSENGRQLYIPDGFAHGFAVLTDCAEVQYKCSNIYVPELESSIRWDDPEINIAWPIKDPSISDRDSNAPLLKDIIDQL